MDGELLSIFGGILLLVLIIVFIILLYNKMYVAAIIVLVVGIVILFIPLLYYLIVKNIEPTPGATPGDTPGVTPGFEPILTTRVTDVNGNIWGLTENGEVWFLQVDRPGSPWREIVVTNFLPQQGSFWQPTRTIPTTGIAAHPTMQQVWIVNSENQVFAVVTPTNPAQWRQIPITLSTIGIQSNHFAGRDRTNTYSYVSETDNPENPRFKLETTPAPTFTFIQTTIDVNSTVWAIDNTQNVWFIEPTSTTWTMVNRPLGSVNENIIGIMAHPIESQVWLITSATSNNVRYLLVRLPENAVTFEPVVANNTLKNLAISFDGSLYYFSGDNTINTVQYATGISPTSITWVSR